jgi:cyclohexanone monooxygenase
MSAISRTDAVVVGAGFAGLYQLAHAERAAAAALLPTADSWCVEANVLGKARVFMVYLGGLGTYRELCDGVATRGYGGFPLDVQI